MLADAEYDYGGQAIVGFRALLGVPIVFDGELIGAVSVGRSVPGAFAEEQVELVRTFADQAAVAIANARMLDAIERQRTELARSSRRRSPSSSHRPMARGFFSVTAPISPVSSVIFATSLRSPRPRLRRICSRCSVSTTRRLAGSSRATRGRSNTSPETA